MEEWARHFEHEYIIKLSKKDLVSHQLNLMLNSDQGLAWFRQTHTLGRQKQDYQQGFLSTMFRFSTLAETIFIIWHLILSDYKQNKYMSETSSKSFNNWHW